MKKILLIIALLFCASICEAQPKYGFGITTQKTFIDTNGLPYNVVVQERGLENVYLIRMDEAVTVQGVEVGGSGYYVFDFTSLSNYQGNYELYVGGTTSEFKRASFGTRQIGVFFDTQAANQTITAKPTFQNNLHLGVEPSDDADAVSFVYLTDNFFSKTESNTNFMKLSGSNTISATNSFTGLNTFNTTLSGGVYPRVTAYFIPGNDLDLVPRKFITDNYLNFAGGLTQTITGLKTFVTYPRIQTYVAPTVDEQFAPKKYVDNKVAQIVTPGQSPNEIIYFKTASTISGKQYGDLLEAATVGKDRITTGGVSVYINVKGVEELNPSDEGFIDASNSSLYADRLHYIIVSKFIEWNMSDANITVTQGTASIKNARIKVAVNQSTFNGMVFEDCEFNLTTHIDFINCTFRGTCTFINTGSGSIDINNCKGTRIQTNILPTITGTSPAIDYSTSLN